MNLLVSLVSSGALDLSDGKYVLRIHFFIFSTFHFFLGYEKVCYQYSITYSEKCLCMNYKINLNKQD